MGVIAKDNKLFKKKLDLINEFYRIIYYGETNNIEYIDDDVYITIVAENGSITITIKDTTNI